VWVLRLGKQQRFFERHKNDDEEALEVEDGLVVAADQVVQEEEVEVGLKEEEVGLAEAEGTLVGVVAVLLLVVLGHRTVLLLVNTDQGNHKNKNAPENF